MKKMMFLICCAWFALSLNAAIDINGDFDRPANGLPAQWYMNPYIKCSKSIDKKDGVNYLKLAAAEKSGQVYSKPFPGKNGDIFKVSVNISGSGPVFIGLLCYDAKYKYVGSFKSPVFQAGSEVKNYVKEFSITNFPGKAEVAFLRLSLNVEKTSSAVFSSVVLEKIIQKAENK